MPLAQQPTRGAWDNVRSKLWTAGGAGTQLARDLKRLLDRKDNAHYGAISISATGAADMLGWARRMVTAAGEVLAR